MGKRLKHLGCIGLAYLLLTMIAAVILAEASLHLHRLSLRHQPEAANLVRQRYHAELQDAAITAKDGVALKAWYVHPQQSNGDAVILLHGITDNREGMAGYARLFLDHGYSVLLPDARAHGESGGELATYGIKESDDIHRWINWLYAHDLAENQCVFGFGESYGAALVLQSLAVEPRFCAVIAESPFSTAREMSYERISGPLHLQPWFGRTIGRPVITAAVLYARWRYGIDLLQPSPVAAIERTSVPVLLIHGEADRNISPRHSMILAAAAPAHVELWLVPHAGHTMAWAAAHQEFESRVLGWFQAHSANSKAQFRTAAQ